ncbi:MAG: T9SS type A sorting domain-containing protein [Bacteroidia bacterium]|nr:T9SS type A sorting domain-containing protein [Bacteroidia bacterium]
MKQLNRIFFASLFALSFLPVSAQNTFEKKYGTSAYEEFWGAAVMSDSTIVYAGYSDVDAYILRVDRFGDTLWTTTISDPGLDLLYTVSETKDHGIIAAGRSSSYGSGGMDMYLVKLNSAGQVLWRKAIGSADHEVANKVFCCADKGFLLSGYTREPSAMHNDAYLVKTDSLGNILWTKAFGGVDDDNAYSVIELPNTDIVVTGITVNSMGNVMLAKLSASGIFKWKKIYGTSGDDRAYSIVPASNGDLYVGGLVETTKMLIFKTDSMGNVLWSKSYGNPATNQWGYSLSRCGNNHLLLCGHQGVGGHGADYILIKTDLNGDTVWTRNYGFQFDDYAQSVVEYPGGGCILSGYSMVSPGNYDLYTIKADSLGNTSCSARSAPVQVTNLIFSPGNYVVIDTSFGSSITAPFVTSSLGNVQTICESCPAPDAPADITPDQNKTRCEFGVATLSVTSSANVFWYGSASSNVVLNTGLVYQAPVLSAGVYTFYAEAVTCRESNTRLAITVTVTNCMGISDKAGSEGKIVIYPNPMQTISVIRFTKYISAGELCILDLTGRKLRSMQFYSVDQLNIVRGDLTEGVYLFEVYDQVSGETFRAKIAVTD